MARIRDEDVVTVRERARIDDVVREHVALKPAGGGSLKGLCPFHEERSPSFHVTPSKGFYHCFSCQAGGDVITFVKNIEHLTFAEAVEKLAAKYNVQLRYEEGSVAPGRQQGQRTRLVEANKVAAAFYVEQLAKPEAEIGRRFLTERGFDSAAAITFGVGYAPKSWDALTSMLRAKGFSDDELLAAGLVSQGNRGPYDRFRGRLVWPIRDLGSDVVGFGARKLHDGDEGPKYLNTPETPLYKKSQVLYGIDLARKAIASSQRAVIVEGYTDVMACHIAGVEVAVATCGTAFGTDHIRLLRRLLMDQDAFKGEVVFTFDGDAAGRRAALKAFDDDQKFVSQTFVAVEPNGLDPCDLRLAHGDEAVRELVAARIPLFEFAIRSALADVDLNTAEGRVTGLREAAPLVARIRDHALRPEYTRMLAGWLGMDVDPVRAAVASALKNPPRPAPVVASRSPGGEAPVVAAPVQMRPDPNNLNHHVEREALKAALHRPGVVGPWFDTLESEAFTFPPHAGVHAAIITAGGAVAGASLGERGWVDAVLTASEDDVARSLVTALVVEPLRSERGETDDIEDRYAIGIVARLLELDAMRRVAEVKGRLQRVDAAAEPDEYERLTRDLFALEAYRRDLRTRSTGEE
ncbi:MAG: DNA primase [Actinomycetes bacterium]